MSLISSQKIRVVIFLLSATVAFVLFQNATVLDFTKTSKDDKLSALEQAIASSDSERQSGQKELGLDDNNIHKKYMIKQRNPNAVVGDISVAEAEKDKKQRLKKKSQKLRRKTK